MTEAQMQPNKDKKAYAAVKFLKQYNPNGWHVLTAIGLNRKIETCAFSVDEEDKMVRWIVERNGKMNLYFHVNSTIVKLNKRAKREDIKNVEWLHVDIDPDPNEDIEQERERILDMLTDKLPANIPPPTFIVFSGGGYQAFWKLKTPIEINGDLAKAEIAKLYNIKLEQVFGADNCHNIDRIMRLAGTENIPDEKKLKKGRVKTMAQVIDFNDVSYDIEAFTPAIVITPPTADLNIKVAISDIKPIADLSALDEWNVPDRMKVIIARGKHPEEPKEGDNSRSIWLFDCVCGLVRSKVPDNVIFSIITDSDWRISESVLELGCKAHDYAIRQIERAKTTVNDDKKDFTRDQDGNPHKTQENVILALKKLGVTVKYNKFSDRDYISGLKGFEPYLSDAAVTRIYLDIDKKYGFRVGKDMFWMIITDQAKHNSYHPVQDYLNDLTWDGNSRINNWLVTYGGAADTRFNRVVGRIVLIAAIRRIMSPGCKFDEMLILEGSQGCGKSTALKILAVKEDWFIDDLPLDRDSKKNIESLSGHWIVEAGELKGMRKGEVENLKGFLSRSTDKARMAYGRITAIAPRQCIIIGTTNNDRYLKDSTGNRRFWPVKIEGFDLKALKDDVDQIWAEACHYEAKGESIRLDPALYESAHLEQELRRVEDPYFETLYEVLEEQTGKVKMSSIWSILDIPKDRRTQEQNNRIGAAMQELGWEKTKLRFGGKNPENCYAKGTPEQRKKEFAYPTKPSF